MSCVSLIEADDTGLERQVGRLLERLDEQQNDASDPADTEPEDKRVPQTDETSEADAGESMTAKGIVGALRTTAGEVPDA